MEAFHNLMATHIALKETADKSRNEKIAHNALSEGLSFTFDILCEINAKSGVKGRFYECPKKLLDDLRAYKCCPVEKGKDVSYITAELSSVIIAKLIDRHETHEKITVIRDEDDSIVCSCNHVNYKDDLEELIDVLLQLKSVNRLKVSCFVSSVIDLNLPVGVLSALQKADLVPVSVYISHNESKKDVLHLFIKDLISHLGRIHINGKQADEKLCEGSVQLLSTLLHLGLCEDIAEPGPATSLICNQSCQEFLEQLLIEITNHVLSKEDGSSLGKHFLQLRERKWHMNEIALQKYFLKCMQSVARSPYTSAHHSLALQQHWFHAEVEPSFGVYLKYLLTAMGEEGTHSGIVSMIKQESSQWQNILLFITVYLTIFSGAATAMKAFVDDCLVRALTKQSHSLLACAFLVARQACLNSAVPSVRNIFPSYGMWFASAFGAEAGSVQTSTNAVTFSFLMEFLTDLVPTDPPFCLRVHINKVPSAPVHCSHILSDYVSLAKTRLKDLGEAIGSGLFAFENTPQEDVAAALMHFERSGGQISRVLLDSSKFRRMQFEHQFLPALLVPEPVCEEQSTRQLLITKLQVLGKIPHIMFKQFEKACHHITAQRSGQWKLGPISGTPLERWQAILELLVNTVRDNGVDHKGVLTEEGKAVLSSVGVQLETLLIWIAEQSDPGSLQRKVVGRLLKACEFCFEPSKPQGLERSPSWVCNIVSLLKSHPGLLRQFRGAVYRIACDITRMPHVIEAAATLAYVLDFCNQNIFSHEPTVPLDGEKLGEAVGQALQPITQKSMLHALAFSSSYLRLVDKACAGTLPQPRCVPSLLRIFTYLHERLLYSSVQEVLDVYAHSWTPSSSWAGPILECQLSLTEWLDLEAEIDRTEDPLTMRHLYLSEWITHHVSQCPAPELLIASLTGTKKGNATWGSEVLQIIPSVVTNSSSQKQTETVPWLLETWTNISACFSPNDILKCVQNLPSWLLLTNTFGVTPTPVSVNALANFLTKHMDKMSEKGFLSLNIVCTVIGAARASVSQCQSVILSQIIDACPALYLSILRHGQKLRFQLVPSFTDTCPMGCSLERIMKLVTDDVSLEQAETIYSWEAGLVHWSKGVPLPQEDDGSLFFHMLDLGTKLLTGSVVMSMVTKGPVLPSTVRMAHLLVQEPLHCFKMVTDAIKESPCLPAAGISHTARVGLFLATMGVMLSLDIDHIPSPGSETAKVCHKVLQQCLEGWKERCREIDCDSCVQEVAFVQWLTKCINKLLESFQCK